MSEVEEPTSKPLFAMGHLVMIAPFNQKGKPKSDLANKSAKYYAHTGVVASVGLPGKKSITGFVYRVKMEDGNVLELTEDCLFRVKPPGR